MSDHPKPVTLAGTDAPLADGELVVLTDRKGRRYLVTLEAGTEWHSHAGAVPHDDLIGGVEGRTLRTNRNMEVTVFRPTREEFVLKMKRGAQVIYTKDQAMILAEADIQPGCTVVEAGAGSGALTMALLSAVGPTGKVISFERREEHLRVARRNVSQWFGGEPENWEVRAGDLAEGLSDLSAHRVVLDMLEPWQMVAGAAEALAPGGIILAYTPTVPQVMRFTDALWDDGRFSLVKTNETLVRGWDVNGLAVRPGHRMVAHTAFLTTARRTLPRDAGGPPLPRRKQNVGPSIDWDAMDAASDDSDVSDA